MNGESVTHVQLGEQQGKDPVTNVGASSAGFRGKGFLIPAVIIASLLFLQWPMLKGLFYRTFGIDAPVSTIDWRKDFGSAIAEARESDKPLLLVFSASWCPPCIVMKHEVWSDSEVSEVVKNGFVPLHIDVDDKRDAAIAARYGIRGIPAVLIIDADGDVLRRESFMSRLEMISFLKQHSSKDSSI